jgi:Trypsin-like peptidase domain
MIKDITYAILYILFVFTVGQVEAQFNPDKLAKSTVRINIKQNGKVVSTATGFLWQNNNQVVTSLHVMRSGAEIQIEYQGAKTTADVKKVLQSADLVLLQVDNPIQGWKALKNYDSNKPAYKSELSALGYNNGAPGLSTRELKKGYVNPEILKLLVPPDDRNVLINSKMPDINLPIYYLNGTLLPGFSGAPVVNKNGSLIGIGDGGLENGASAVSWVIPATYLDQLTSSNVKSLPASLSKSGLLFSADLDVQEDYISVRYKDFEFVKTKTRTFNQLLKSADNPDELKYALSLFDDFDVDYNSFQFDIYEDGEYGLVITIPSGAGLSVYTDDEGDEVLSATGNIYGEDAPYDIDFMIEQPDKVFTDPELVKAILDTLADIYLTELNDEEIDDYVEAENFRRIEDYGNGKFILRTEFNDFENDLVEKRGLTYITFATDSQIYFLSRCIIDRFDDDFEEILDKYEEIDCTQGNLNSEQQEVCQAVKEMLQIMTSVHLTSFSNKINQN